MGIKGVQKCSRWDISTSQLGMQAEEHSVNKKVGVVTMTCASRLWSRVWGLGSWGLN
jgi:hypothetical protein